MYRALLAVWLSGFLKFVPLCFSVSPFSLRFTPLISVPVPEIPVAHRPVGDDNERERNGNWGRGNGQDGLGRPLAWR